MKSKLKVLSVFGLLIIGMSSCVYSLFPIYTEDTLVYLPELEGKWLEHDNEGNYIVFESNAAIEASLSVKPGPADPQAEAEITHGFSIDFGEDEFIKQKAAWGQSINASIGFQAYWCQVKQMYSPLFMEALNGLVTKKTC